MPRADSIIVYEEVMESGPGDDDTGNNNKEAEVMSPSS